MLRRVRETHGELHGVLRLAIVVHTHLIRTSLHARFAPNASFRVHGHNACFFILHGSTRGTHLHARGILAMLAGHRIVLERTIRILTVRRIETLSTVSDDPDSTNYQSEDYSPSDRMSYTSGTPCISSNQ